MQGAALAAEIHREFDEYSGMSGQSHSIGAAYQSFGSSHENDNRGFRIGTDRRYSSNYSIVNQEKLLYFSQLLKRQPVEIARKKAEIGRGNALGLASLINKEARVRKLTDVYFAASVTVKSVEDEKLLDRIRLNRYGANGIYCPHCGSGSPYKCGFGYYYSCSNSECHRNIYPLVGTIYENSKMPLSKWLAIEQHFAEDLNFNQSKLAKELFVTQATVWKIVQKLKAPSYNSAFSLLLMKPVVFL